MKTLKKILIALISFLIIIYILANLIGNYFVTYTLTNNSDSQNRKTNLSSILSESEKKKISLEMKNEKEKVAEFEKANSFETVNIESKDKLKLSALMIDNKSDKWAILVHGYKTSNNNMKGIALEYLKNGYNVLLIDNRAHGKSEGEYITMGWFEKEDIALWVDYINQKRENQKIVLHGISMGAASVLNATALNLKNVVVTVEDSSYTSVWDIFKSELKARFSLPSFPVLDFSRYVAKKRAKFDIKKASTIDVLNNAKIPILFIHGSKDDFVPVDMAYKLYEKYENKKSLYVFEGASHADSRFIDKDKYYEVVFNFLNENVK